jgi:hypothetical protein
MKIEVTESGYYNSTNNRVCLLKQGEVVDCYQVHSGNLEGWMCESSSGQSVFIEKENGIVLD